jgi:ketosteroid isomerase-like protein
MTTKAIVDQFFERLQAGDADGVGQLFASEIDWYVPGHPDLPWTGRRTRREDVSEYLQTMWPQFVPGASKIDVDKVLFDGDEAVVFSTFQHTVKANGRTFTTPTAIRLVTSNDEIVKMQLFEDTRAVANAFFADNDAEGADL